MPCNSFRNVRIIPSNTNLTGVTTVRVSWRVVGTTTYTTQDFPANQPLILINMPTCQDLEIRVATLCGTTQTSWQTATVPAQLGPLQMLSPYYVCNSDGTGTLTVRTQGGDGTTALEYRVAGLRDWGASPVFTTPGYQQSGTPFTLQARQGSVVVSQDYTTNCTGNTPPSSGGTAPDGGGGGSTPEGGLDAYWRLLDADANLLGSAETLSRLSQWRQAGGTAVSIGINQSAWYEPSVTQNGATITGKQRWDALITAAIQAGLKVYAHLTFGSEINEAAYLETGNTESVRLARSGLNATRISKKSNIPAASTGRGQSDLAVEAGWVPPMMHLFLEDPADQTVQPDGLKRYAWFAKKFVQDVRDYYAAKNVTLGSGSVTMLSQMPVVSFAMAGTQEIKYQNDERGGSVLWIGGYSGQEVSDFRLFLQTNLYSTIGELKTAWGVSSYTSFGDVQLPAYTPGDQNSAFRGASGRDHYAWKHDRLKRTCQAITGWIRSIFPAGVKVKYDYGQTEWDMGVPFVTAAFEDLSEDADIIKENYTLGYGNFRFSTEYSRSGAGGKPVHLELFGAEVVNTSVAQAFGTCKEAVELGSSGISFFGTGSDQFSANLQVLQRFKNETGYLTQLPTLPQTAGSVSWSLQEQLNGSGSYQNRRSAYNTVLQSNPGKLISVKLTGTSILSGQQI